MPNLMQLSYLLEVKGLTKKELQKHMQKAIPDGIYQRIQFRMAIQNTICTIVTIAAAILLAANLWFPILQVYGNSMSPTLRTGDVLLCIKTDTLVQGDITAFYHNNKLLIKRVIGCGGDWVDIDPSGTVMINDDPISEPYINDPAMGQVEIAFPCQVPQESYFVLGDCRGTSLDSRSEAIGYIPEDRILCKVLLRIWPLNRFGRIDVKGGGLIHDS